MYLDLVGSFFNLIWKTMRKLEEDNIDTFIVTPELSKTHTEYSVRSIIYSFILLFISVIPESLF